MRITFSTSMYHAHRPSAHPGDTPALCLHFAGFLRNYAHVSRKNAPYGGISWKKIPPMGDFILNIDKLKPDYPVFCGFIRTFCSTNRIFCLLFAGPTADLWTKYRCNTHLLGEFNAIMCYFSLYMPILGTFYAILHEIWCFICDLAFNWANHKLLHLFHISSELYVFCAIYM